MTTTPASDGALASTKAPTRKVLAWAFWDWGTQPFATVITTFVFAVYLTSSAFGEKDEVTMKLAWATGIAGLFIALLAPVLGQGSDRTGKRIVPLQPRISSAAIETSVAYRASVVRRQAMSKARI